VAGTKVDTPTGSVAIDQLNVGDKVLAHDFYFHRPVESVVIAKKCSKAEYLVEVKTERGSQFVCTVDHLIYVPLKGWIQAKDLLNGFSLIRKDGKNDSVVSSQCYFSANTPVYDIEVAYHHNFFADGIVAHNCIILDDCNSAKEVESELVIASTLEWFDGTLGTRLNNQKLGAVINVQQRLGENDITGHILSKNTGEWCHLMLPMEYEPERSYVNAYGWKDPRAEPGELLWPERFGPEEVTALKNWMGTWRSNGQLQQRPSPKGGGIIKREWWQPWERVEFPPMDFILGTLDTAYTLEQMNDPSGMIIWGVFSGDPVGRSVRSFDHNGRLAYSERTYTEPEAPKVMALHAWTDRLEFYELIKRTAETCIRLKVDLLLVENKAAGISVAQELRRLYGHQSFSVQLFDPKSQDKFARLVSVQHLFQEKLIYVPTADYLWIDEMITQIEGFPRAKHDEYVDLTSMGLRYLRDRGLISRAVERRAEMDSLKIYPRGQDIPLYPA
jgi:predicted phage terminase large subunit-like protein